MQALHQVEVGLQQRGEADAIEHLRRLPREEVGLGQQRQVFGRRDARKEAVRVTNGGGLGLQIGGAGVTGRLGPWLSRSIDTTLTV